MPMGNPYQTPFTNALQQAYNLQPTPQPLQQPQPQQQTITTQPPIMQPQASVNRILPVANREEATVAPIDLINGTPSYFINKSNGEIYYKQFDVPSGSYIFKTYAEVQPQAQEQQTTPQNIPNYEKEMQYLIAGVDNLHRMIAQLQNKYPVNIETVKADVIDVEPEPIEEKTFKTKKRGQ